MLSFLEASHLGTDRPIRLPLLETAAVGTSESAIYCLKMLQLVSVSGRVAFLPGLVCVARLLLQYTVSLVLRVFSARCIMLHLTTGLLTTVTHCFRQSYSMCRRSPWSPMHLVQIEAFIFTKSYRH